ncbi:MAG: 4-hydroxy-tetrahydrodipicolinate synthase [Thermoleophilia bacterium]|nr:4-hydroxy-tetrahydrodipicolinate synthase [Thermoleophilia bacterium]
MIGSVLTAMVTPFDESGAVDWTTAAELMHHLVDHGSDGLVLSGTTGESPTLTDEEKIALFRLGVSEVGDRASIVAGTGSNDTAHSVHLTEAAHAAGVDAVLAVTPYYNKPPREGLLGHFGAIAAVGAPVILYNIPGRCVINMGPDLIAEISRIPGVVGIKEANPDRAHMNAVSKIDDLLFYAGNDDTFIDALELGGAGVISVASHLVGPQMVRIWQAAADGDLDTARELDRELHDLYAGLFITANPILVKAALQMLGMLPTSTLRLPLVEATPVQRDILATVLDRQGILASS